MLDDLTKLPHFSARDAVRGELQAAAQEIARGSGRRFLVVRYRRPVAALVSVADLVTHREANLLLTLVTTNLTGEEFKERYGERIASRLNGDGVGFHALTGPDLRIKARAEREADESDGESLPTVKLRTVG